MEKNIFISIEKIELDENSILYIKPLDYSFEKIYRSGMGVRWDNTSSSLYSESPINQIWGVLQWYVQIVSAIKDEYGIILKTYANTVYKKIDSNTKSAIEEFELPFLEYKSTINDTEPVLTIKFRKSEYVFFRSFFRKMKNGTVEFEVNVKDIFSITYNEKYWVGDFLTQTLDAWGSYNEKMFNSHSPMALVIDFYPKSKQPIVLKATKQEYMILKEKFQKRINLI